VAGFVVLQQKKEKGVLSAGKFDECGSTFVFSITANRWPAESTA
jgi:hypothetical protein